MAGLERWSGGMSVMRAEKSYFIAHTELFDTVLVPYRQIFCHKKQEEDCERATSLIWNNGSME